MDLEISPEQQLGLAQVAQRHAIRLIIAFGSQVAGTPHQRSDLDLAVLLEQPAATDDDLGLINDLQRLFPGQPVDVVWLHRADPLLGREIFRRAQLLHGHAQDMARYSTYAWRRFVEYQRFFAIEAEAVREGIARLHHAR